MWVCPKCSRQISDGSKICRQCGAILEEVEDKGTTPGDFQSDLSGQSDQVSATEEKQRSPVQADSLIDTSEDDERSDEERVQPDEDQHEPELARGLRWTCQNCGENVPSTFDVCWNCGTTVEGLENADFVKERPDVGETTQPDVASGVEPRRDLETTTRCAKCGSSKIIPDVTVADQGQGSDGTSKVVVYGDPDALFFKDRRYGTVKAHICGDCGYVELWVPNPRELYEHYLESLDE